MNKLIAVLCAALTATASHAAEAAKRPVAKSPPETVIVIPQESLTARVVDVRQKEIPSIRARIRFTTLIILPADERILDFTCGDKEYWVIEGAHNLAYVKPAKSGAKTNMNLVTASGTVYSFLLEEVSGQSNPEPDLKVYVKTGAEPAREVPRDMPKLVSADELEALQAELDKAREETKRVRKETDAAMDGARASFMASMRFPYRFTAGEKPFRIRGMAHDGTFTYIQARPDEVPTLYELRDGKQPNLVNFTYQNGLYVVNKVLTRGYLAIGKRKAKFDAEE